MNPTAAFVSVPVTVLTSSSFRTSLSPRRNFHCKRAKWRRQSPSMMAKFQQQNTNTEQPDGESQLEDIVPKELPLPTLTTLTGVQQQRSEVSENNQTNQVDASQEIDLSKISAMGPGLSSAEEQSLTGFIKSSLDELKLIEWPSAGRVVRLTALIIVTVIVAVIALYFVDGFFYRVSHILFEGKI